MFNEKMWFYKIYQAEFNLHLQIQVHVISPLKGNSKKVLQKSVHCNEW